MAGRRKHPLPVVVLAIVGTAQNVAHRFVQAAVVVVGDGHGLQSVLQCGRRRESEALWDGRRVGLVAYGTEGGAFGR